MIRNPARLLPLVLGLVLTWTMTNKDGSPTLPLVWYSEVTMYFRTVDGVATDENGVEYPVYSAMTPTRYNAWPGPAECGGPGHCCLIFTSDPGLGDVWMWEDPPVLKPD